VLVARHGRRALLAWAFATAVVLVAGAAWLASPRVGYLAAALGATTVAIVAVIRSRQGPRQWPLVTSALLLLFTALGLAADRAIARVADGWESYNRDAITRGSAALDSELTSAGRELAERARQALDAPRDADSAFAFLGSFADGWGERGIVLYRDAIPLAWSGRVRIATDTLVQPIGFATSEFYLALYATAQRGSDRAVATLLVEARPPADRLSEPLERIVAERVGVADFHFADHADSTALGFFVHGATARPLMVSPAPLVQQRVLLATLEGARVRGTVILALALMLFVAVVWRRNRGIMGRLAALAVALAVVAVAPLNELSNASRLFDPAIYYADLGPLVTPFTSSAGAFAITAALILLGILALLRSPIRIPSRTAAIALVIGIAAGGPFLLRDLARGIEPPAWGVSTGLWLAWEVALFLVAASVLLAGATAGRAALRGWRGLPALVAPSLALAAALVGPLVWEAPARWPGWYTGLWIGAVAALALTRRSGRFLLAASTVASLGAATLVWGNVARKRVALAEREIATLSAVDPTAELLLRRFGDDLNRGVAPLTRAAMLRRYVGSDLAAANFPVAIAAWSPDGVRTEALSMLSFETDSTAQKQAISAARSAGQPTLWYLRNASGLQLLLAVTHQDGDATTVLVVPRTRTERDDPDDPFLALLGIAPETSREPPYSLTITDVPDAHAAGLEAHSQWKREGSELHSDWILTTAPTLTRAHVEVELRPFDALLQRGALVVLMNLLIIGVLWLLAAAADGGLQRWINARRRVWTRSYRARLTLALSAFFVVPALAFALWSYRRLQSGDREARELIVLETLRSVSVSGTSQLGSASSRFETPLLLFGPGELLRTSDPLFEALAPLGRFLDPSVHQELVRGDEVTAGRLTRIGNLMTLVGYRAATGAAGERVVLGAPARTDEVELGRRRRDLGVLVLFATAVGALAALWLSGVAARQFAQPIRSLRGAALAIARGEREPALGGAPPAEFVPVFNAFRRMAGDLGESRLALEEAQRRMAAILRNVASGVVAVDATGTITLANPRADALLGRSLPPGTPLAAAGSAPLERRVAEFIAGHDVDEEEFDLEIDRRQLHVRLTRLAPAGTGAVLTFDDVSELARAQRVLAWGEMARQVAHEIKNPLTPIRLGVQHLRRARADGRGDFDRILEQNVERILAEIDRLDEIARAFSRYGTAPAQAAPAATVDVAHIVRDVVELETLGEGAVHWRLHNADSPAPAAVVADELREVLLNILENARLANATRVDIVVRRDPGSVAVTVADDGDGIPADVLPRIFEPHFSTRTSGSGLGLAISRRMIEGWGGSISVSSELGHGTRVEITLVAR
jgi:signal transduction histidine kinase